MTSNFSLDKKYFKELDQDIQEKVRQAHKYIKEITSEFSNLMDEDSEGFKAVIKVYEDKDIKSEKEKEIKLEESYKKALIAPLKCSRNCLELLKLQDIIVEYGNKDTITDVGVGVVLTFAALEGCLMSVRINLNYIENKNFTDKIEEELNIIYREAGDINNCLREKIGQALKTKE